MPIVYETLNAIAALTFPALVVVIAMSFGG